MLPALVAVAGAAPLALECQTLFCRALQLTALAVLAVWVAWHRHQVFKLQQWFASPNNVLPPPASGDWEEAFSLGYRWRKGQEQQREFLHNTLSQFREAIDILPNALLLLNPEGQILWANRACESLLGLGWPQDRGQPLSYLVRNPKFLAFFEADAPGIIQIPAPASPDKILEGNRYMLPDGGSLMVFREITRLLQLEQIRRDFVANVSHELRSPLTVLSGFVETLQETPGCDNGEVRHYLELMSKETTRMQKLVGDLLTLARLEAGAAQSEDCDLVLPAELVEQSLQSLQDAIAGKQLDVRVELDPTLCVRAYTLDIISIVRNLMENAVKYTHSGDKIRIIWELEGNEGLFAVEDTGEGIAQEHLHRLTERFYRVDKGRSRAVGGTGLGLSIVKHAVARYDGQFQVKSKLGEGSRFSVKFPPHRICHHRRGAMEANKS